MFSILIVEDNPIDAKIIEHVILKKGYVCHYAKDAFQAFEITEKYKIDLVLLDWQLPKVSGMDFLKTIRGQDRYKVTPILIVSGRNEEKDVKKAIVEGATDYVIKPIDVLILDTKIDRYLSQKTAWQMTPVSDVAMSEGLANISVNILAVSEVGFELKAPFDLNIGNSIVINCAFLMQAGITNVVAKVFGVYEHNGQNIYKCSLIGMKEVDLQKLRIAIRKLPSMFGEKEEA